MTLFLGGLGVMNVMLVAVRERTREIGVRKAIGAPAHSILRQFFLEALMVALISGGTGLLIAFGLCALVDLLPMPDFFAGLLADMADGNGSSGRSRNHRHLVRRCIRLVAPPPSIPSKPCATRQVASMGMIYQVLNEAWTALRRNRTRSALTMLGIVWGIATVTLLIAYGGSFREILVSGFNAFGKGAVICWPQQTSEQPGGQRAGKKVVLEQADLDMIKETANYVRHACLETVRRPGIAYGDRMVGTAPVRGVCPEYGDMRNEQPSEGRWINSLDELERRRVVFLGARVREQLFGGRPAVGETVAIAGVRFTVIGTMDRKIQLSNYFSSDDESTWIPYSAANDL